VPDLDDLFEAAETLASIKTIPGDRLAIVTNGGGAGVLAADTISELGGTLATLDARTMETLNKALPPTWSHGNPIDIIGDAGSERYRAAMEAALSDTGSDVVLVMNCPTALASSQEAAKATVEAAAAHRRTEASIKPIVASWLGDGASPAIQALFEGAKIPYFATPGAAVRGVMQLVRYKKAQAELMQTPPAMPEKLRFDSTAVDGAIAQTLREGRAMMTEPEAKSVLAAYDIPTVKTLVAATPEEARRAAAELLQVYSSVVVKILSPELTHKSDIGGVRLDITSADDVERIARQMLGSIRAAKPGADLRGFTIQPMIRRPDAYELILGITTDPTFGPVVLFGAGGTGVEAIGDTAMALTPLDLKLASELIASTRIYKLLRGFRGRPAADLEGLALSLVKISSLALQHRAIRELDINPLLVDEKGMLALDARIRVEDPITHPAPPPAIRPYPSQWERRARLQDGSEVFIRPIRPDDERLYATFASRVTPEDARLRLFAPVRELSHQFLARLTQIDYAREVAFIALGAQEEPEMLGVVRFFADPDYDRAEYAVMVRSDLKGHGLGWVLMRHLIAYATAEGLSTLHGSVLRENQTMLQMCRELGFSVNLDMNDPHVCSVALDLKSDAVKGLTAGAPLHADIRRDGLAGMQNYLP
jgi:acetyltransferase